MRPSPGRLAALSLSVSLAISLTIVAPAEAATATNAWQAKIGSGGANGMATLQAYTTGTGSLALKLAKLKPATSVPVVLARGSCSGAALITFPAIKTSSAGAASRTSSLTASQVSLVKGATANGGRIAIRVGNSSTGGVKCGYFLALPVPAYVAATIAVGPLPSDVAIAPNGIWVANYYDGTLSRVDPATNSLLATIPLNTKNTAPWRLTYAEGSLWVVGDVWDAATQKQSGTTLLRLDPASGAVIATIPLSGECWGIGASPGAVWVTGYDSGTLWRIDTATNQVAAKVSLAEGVLGVAYDFGSLWVANGDTGAVSRVDPASNQAIATIATVGDAVGVASGAGAIWVSNYGTSGQPDGVVSRIDPATNQVVRTITVGTNPWSIGFGGGYLWVALTGDPQVVQVDPTTNAVKATITTGALVLGSDTKVIGLRGLAASDHDVWTTQPLPVTEAYPLEGMLIRITF